MRKYFWASVVELSEISFPFPSLIELQLVIFQVHTLSLHTLMYIYICVQEGKKIKTLPPSNDENGLIVPSTGLNSQKIFLIKIKCIHLFFMR